MSALSTYQLRYIDLFRHDKVFLLSFAIYVHILYELLRIHPYRCHLGEGRGLDLTDGGWGGENRPAPEPPTHHREHGG